jgi:hypothetical protein
MNEEILVAFVEKFDQFDKRIQVLEKKIDSIPNLSEEFGSVRGDLREMKMEVKSLPSQLSIPESSINILNENVLKAIELFKKPPAQKVKNIHYLSKPLIFIFIPVGIIIWLCLWLRDDMDIISRMKENDLKYRTIILSPDNNLTRVIHEADSLYIQNPTKLNENVKTAETYRLEKFNELNRNLKTFPQKEKQPRQ